MNCLRRVEKLEATQKIESELSEREIILLKRHFEELGSQCKSREDLLCMTNDELVERKANELLGKVGKLEVTHKIDLEEKKRKIRSLKQHLEVLDG